MLAVRVQDAGPRLYWETRVDPGNLSRDGKLTVHDVSTLEVVAAFLRSQSKVLVAAMVALLTAWTTSHGCDSPAGLSIACSQASRCMGVPGACYCVRVFCHACAGLAHGVCNAASCPLSFWPQACAPRVTMAFCGGTQT